MTKKFNPKITPGPWESCRIYHEFGERMLGHICYGKDCEHIADIVYSECDANAIAAIPEMLEVVKAVREYVVFIKNDPCHTSREFLPNGIIGIVEALYTLDEKHGTEEVS